MPCFQGTRYTRNFQLLYCSSNTPIDITGWEFRGMIRDNRSDPDFLVELTTANGGFLVINGTSGRLQFTLSPIQTASLPTGRVMFDVERTDLVVEGPIWIFEASFKVKTPITRDAA
jgi:hypothetical protein